MVMLEATPQSTPGKPAASHAPDSNGGAAGAAGEEHVPDRQPTAQVSGRSAGAGPPPGQKASGLGRFLSKIGIAGESVAPEVGACAPPVGSLTGDSCGCGTHLCGSSICAHQSRPRRELQEPDRCCEGCGHQPPAEGDPTWRCEARCVLLCRRQRSRPAWRQSGWAQSGASPRRTRPPSRPIAPGPALTWCAHYLFCLSVFSAPPLH